MATVAETIKENTRKHLLENNGLLFGQCVRAVGWIGGTVPELTEEQGIVELPTSDCSNSGIVCGAALVGRKPIYVIRYQGFLWYNAASLVNYAAKSLYLWDQPCPVFVRAIAMEGAIGPVAGGMHHSMIARMPGIKTFCPITPKEWQEAWNYFLENNEPVFCSEHRLSFNNNQELPHIQNNNPDIAIFGIGPIRLKQKQIVDDLWIRHKIKASFTGVYDIENIQHFFSMLYVLNQAKIGIIIDSDYAGCGLADKFATELMILGNKKVYPIGINHKTAGFSKNTDVLTPTPETIIDFITRIY